MSAEPRSPRLVVGVGASAGGLEAFQRFLAGLPADLGMAFLLVQHLDPRHESLLGELLAARTQMPVVNARHDLEIRPDHIYVIQPDTALGVRGDRLQISAPTLHRGVRLPVDHLFRSLAREYGPAAAGIVLSGAGSDGSAGLRDLKAAGGLTIAQDPATSGQPGMPQSAIDTGLIDLVLPIEEIPKALERYAELPASVLVQVPDEGDDETLDFEGGPEIGTTQLLQLAALLEARLDFDLRVYKSGTVERRLRRRMMLSGFIEAEPYFAFLRDDDHEQQKLVRDLLISVTEFFRDPESFDALRRLVIGPLVESAPAGSTARVWVAGCATGEEAYSIGIELLDAIDTAGKRLSVQIFATDVDQAALTVARAGLYPPSISEQVSKHRLETYFDRIEGKGYKVRSKLRDVVSFAAHDLTKDPPFSRMNLVSCRNVLIYLTPDAQRRVLEALHFALRPKGHLFLSRSESTGSLRQRFSQVSKPARIYRKTGASRPIELHRKRRPMSQGELLGSGAGQRRKPSEPERRGRGDTRARQTVLEAWAPPTLIVADDGSVLFMHGELSPYLRFPQGESPQLDVSSLIRPELATRVRGALYKCRREQEKVVVVSSPDRSRAGRVRITALPAPDLGENVALISFEEIDQPAVEPEAPPETPEQQAMIEELERELRATQEDLRNTIEELETSNEELRSANEESMSMNEELQSANEELEATTEELRSLNEELTTVNMQLREKIEQVERAHDDLHNFFASTQVATIFLDDRLRIKRFTPAAAELLDIDHAYLDRSIRDIAREPLREGLEDAVRKVLESFTPQSHDVETREGRWITRQVLPYRTENRRIEGAVVTFLDITEVRRATARIELRERQQAMIARLGLAALRETDLQGFMDQTAREVQQTLETDFCKILETQPRSDKLLLRAGVGWSEGLVGHAYVGTGPESQAGFTLHATEPVVVDDLSEEQRFSGPPLLAEHGVRSGISALIRQGDNNYGVLGAHSKEPGRFTIEDANFLQAVASVVGSALGRYQTRLRLAIELGVAQALAEPGEVDDLLRGVLDCLCGQLHGVLGEVWWPSDDGSILERRQLHIPSAEDEPSIRRRWSRQSFQPGEGLVGRVYAGAKAMWYTDLSRSSLFVRRSDATSLGLVSGIGMPIRSGGEVIGVLTVFARRRPFVDEVLLRLLEGVGRSIGDLVAFREAEARAKRLAAITESSHDAIISYDAEGKITEWLAGAEHLLGYGADDMIGCSIEEIVPEDRREEHRRVSERVHRGEIVEPFETVRRRADGSMVEVSVRVSPVVDRDGRVIGISCTDRDVTRLRETQRRLLAADRQKDEFLAMLGHELRNPLAAIRSAAELLRLSYGDDPKVQRTQAILERQSAHMAKLLDGLLDISRIIRGKINLELEVVDLAALCREVMADLEDRVEGRRLELVAKICERPVCVEGDRIRLTQIVDNLLSNAVKYTEEGGWIELELGIDGEHALLVVRDDGIGIEPGLLPHVFDVFRQSEQSLDRSRGGLGLGLSLVKSLVELHAGRVEAKSEGRDQGTEFSVRLPLTAKRVAQPKGSASEGTESLRILLIEDNEDSAEMLEQLIGLLGHRAAVAVDGREGLERAREARPDVILCDLGLPGEVTGFDVARELRQDRSFDDALIVAISGYGRPEDKERAREAGFDHHLTKPIDVKTLRQLLVSRSASPGLGSSRSAASSPRP